MTFDLFDVHQISLAGSNLTAERIEEVLSKIADLRPYRRFKVETTLPLSISASVFWKDQTQFVEISYEGSTTVLKRKTLNQKDGQISVSCKPSDGTVPVGSFNINFREYRDLYTDRGLVWVEPGERSKVYFYIVAGAALEPGLVTDIVQKAVEAVKQKLLNVLPTAAIL